MPNTKPCQEARPLQEFHDLEHSPVDYDEFQAHCYNVRDWAGWDDGINARMHVGEALCCKTTVSFPPPADLASPEAYVAPKIEQRDVLPECFEPRTGLNDESADAVAEIQRRAVEVAA